MIDWMPSKGNQLEETRGIWNGVERQRDQAEHDFSGEEPDEPNDCIITIENEDQRNVGMRKKNSSSSNDYSRPTKKNTTRNEKHVSFDLRGSPRSIGLFEDVDVEDFEEREFGLHHQFERDFDIGVWNQDIRNTRTFNAGCQELEPNVQIRKKMIARKQREHSDDEDDDDLCNNMEQSMRRNIYQTTERTHNLAEKRWTNQLVGTEAPEPDQWKAILTSNHGQILYQEQQHVDRTAWREKPTASQADQKTNRAMLSHRNMMEKVV